jgi:HlyD family secretion protein
MDRPIEKKGNPRKLIVMIGVGLAIVMSGYFAVGELLSGRSMYIKSNRLSISRATNGVFEDFIPVRAHVVPLKTVFLDAVQGGRVEEVLVEDGASVKTGQVILRLSNTDLQLSVMSTESRIMEQLNAMRDQELRLEQNRLSHKRTLVGLDYNIRRLTREVAIRKALFGQAHISRSEYDGFVEELESLQKQWEVTIESQLSDEKLMVAQIEFFKENTVSMEENLSLVRKSLQDLHVRAPIEGRLSGFEIEIGQNIPRGMRIGQVSAPGEFKMEANIDEFYLGQVSLGHQASFERGNRSYQMHVAKIYPSVKNGRFQVDMIIDHDSPSDLRRGETIQAKLILGGSHEALLIPNGQFFQSTGGQWMFVVNNDGTEAHKRNVRLGRRNNRVIEVLDGLEPGEEAIISSYDGFKEMERLKLEGS